LAHKTVNAAIAAGMKIYIPMLWRLLAILQFTYLSQSVSAKMFHLQITQDSIEDQMGAYILLAEES